ncbi:MAG: Fic family protein [Ruminococcaceae bacterium]|nr:Fic family protein [Oscillospiraceae bacterium]
MSYTLLSHLFYKDKDEYNALYEKRISAESTCILPIKIGGHQAFYCLCHEIHEKSLKIMQLDKMVSAIKNELPPAALVQFANKCLIDEIKLTNDIEGVYSTRKELSDVLYEMDGKAKKKRFYGLLNKYKMLISDTEFSLNTSTDIREIYDDLVLKEIAEECADNIPDGEIFRKDAAEVTTATQKVIHKGAYPETKIIQLMEQSLNILNQKDIPALIRISVFHYLFGYIHPFYDGNGRTSRFISSYLLSKDFEFLIGFRLSYTIKAHIKEYYEAFKECNDEKNCGDLTPFIIMFLNIILESFQNLYEALEKRSNLLLTFSDTINGNSYISEDLKAFALILTQTSLFSSEGITKKQLEAELEISESTVNKRLAKLREAGLLIEEKCKPAKYLIDLNKLS